MKQCLDEILKKMCSYVNADFDSIDFKRTGWYLEHIWTAEQQEDFREWLIEYMKKHKRKLKIYKPVKAANWFILAYGWRCENEKIK